MKSDLVDEADVPIFLTVQETADLLRVSVSTVSSAIHTGKLPALMLGESHRSARIRRSDVFHDKHSSSVNNRRLAGLQRAVDDARDEAERHFANYEDALRRQHRAMDDLAREILALQNNEKT